MRITLTLLLVALTSLTNAQGLEETFDETCECYVVTNHYSNGQVSSLHHENVNRIRDGVEKVYASTGQLNYERTWVNGKLHGDGTHYHQGGQVYLEEHYDHGKKIGEWKFLDESGEVMQSIAYTGNGNDGVYKYYQGGVHYRTQEVTNGEMVNDEILNQSVYEAVVEEASQTTK